MTAADLDQPQQDFLAGLIQAAEGDPGASVDMYQVGTTLGLDKEETRRLGEELIGRWLVEIKNLSGAVGVTEEGLKVAAGLGLTVVEAGPEAGEVLKTEPVAGTDLELSLLTPKAASALRDLAARLLAKVDTAELDQETRFELTSDLCCLTSQLGSPRPKAGVVKEVLLSLVKPLDQAQGVESEKNEVLDWICRLA